MLHLFRILSVDRDVEAATPDNQQKGCHRVTNWKDINAADVKLFFAHIIAMGLLQKSTIAGYWSQKQILKTPFFGKYMSRNTFQLLLSNIHVNDNCANPRRGRAGHDPLHKIRPFIEMCSANFLHAYKPKRELAIDEGCCPWKGRLKFKCYNPRKPHKFHIKLFQLSESDSGYVLAMDVYTGKGKTRCLGLARPDCDKVGVTTKIVLGLCEKARVFDVGHHLYMDNYYSSPELFDELYYRQTYATGTFVARRGLPQCMTKWKSKTKGECKFRRQRYLLCMKWVDKKKPVAMLSTIHSACYKFTGKLHWETGEEIYKPEPIIEYTKFMGGVDLADQLMNYYHFLRRSTKWWRKLFIHFFNMLILNAYILNKKFGSTKLTHEEYREYLVEYLVQESVQNCTLSLPAQMKKRWTNGREPDQDRYRRLNERHFPSHIPAKEGAKRTRPSRACVVCGVNYVLAADGGRPKKVKKNTSFWCADCKQPLCVVPCFERFHTMYWYKPNQPQPPNMIMEVDSDD